MYNFTTIKKITGKCREFTQTWHALHFFNQTWHATSLHLFTPMSLHFLTFP
ncbi:MAG: hypothetical protein HDS84_03575 [Bacteroidales bacterium]|nr:hypothetical protein [Bacteroidales bacterium]MBD5302225.1 hypothetical protein [Bacteroides sp.]